MTPNLHIVYRVGSLEWLQDMFTSCWSLSQCEPHDYDSVRELSLTSTTVLLQWATWGAAQLCVHSKLRTPLGKPLDTFMAFEGNHLVIVGEVEPLFLTYFVSIEVCELSLFGIVS